MSLSKVIAAPSLAKDIWKKYVMEKAMKGVKNTWQKATMVNHIRGMSVFRRAYRPMAMAD
jgi:hypothetical protein